MRQLGEDHILTAEGAEHINFNQLLVLNESAAYLWQSVSGVEFDAERLAVLLQEKYGIDADTARHDAEVILKQWADAGLVEE